MKNCRKCDKILKDEDNYCSCCGERQLEQKDMSLFKENLEEYIKKQNEKFYQENAYSFSSSFKEKIKENKSIYFGGVYIGGFKGGNCWDNSTPEYEKTYNEEKIDNGSLFDFLYNQGFLNPLVISELETIKDINTETEYEYYGNSSDYEYWEYKVDQIINILQKYL
jgi:hypothetical protein